MSEPRIVHRELIKTKKPRRSKPRTCRLCGAPEKKFIFGYSSLTPSGLCPDCINKAIKEAV